MFPTPVVATARLAASTPQGGRHQCFAKLGTCRQNFSGDTYQGATTVNNTTTGKQLGGKMEARVSAKKIRVLAVQAPRSRNTIAEVQINRQHDNIVNYWNNRKRRKSYSRAEGLRVLRLMLELLCYCVGSILNAVPGSLRRPFDGPLHRRLQGDAGVTAPKAHQHMVSHHLC
jgi:hypothetical protein